LKLKSDIAKAESINVETDLSEYDLKEYTRTKEHMLKFLKDSEEAKMEILMEARVGLPIKSRIEKYYKNNYDYKGGNEPIFVPKPAHKQKGDYPYPYFS